MENAATWRGARVPLLLPTSRKTVQFLKLSRCSRQPEFETFQPFLSDGFRAISIPEQLGAIRPRYRSRYLAEVAKGDPRSGWIVRSRSRDSFITLCSSSHRVERRRSTPENVLSPILLAEDKAEASSRDRRVRSAAIFAIFALSGV